jgi:hypothetical protein
MKVFGSNGPVGSIATLALLPPFWPVIDRAFGSSGGGEAAEPATTLACLNPAISFALKPNSASTSSVCSPNSGGRAAILLGVRDSVTGWPTGRMWRFSAFGTSCACLRYSTNYLIDLDYAVIVEVEASSAIRQAEVTAAKAMITRVHDRFDLHPVRLKVRAAASNPSIPEIDLDSWRPENEIQDRPEVEQAAGRFVDVHRCHRMAL